MSTNVRSSKTVNSSGLRLLPEQRTWSWKKRLGVLVNVFGVLWLFAEPLANAFAKTWLLPVWTYVAIVAIAVVAPVAMELLARRRVLGNIEMVRFTVVLTSSGSRIPVQAPHDMLVTNFVKTFLERVVDQSPLSALHPQVLPLYDLNLLVDRRGKYQPIPGDKTLREAGVSNGDLCKIGGYIRVEYSHVVLSIKDAHAVADVRQAQSTGTVFLDEDVAVEVGCFRGQGLSEARVVVVDNLGGTPDQWRECKPLSRVVKALTEAGYHVAASEEEKAV